MCHKQISRPGIRQAQNQPFILQLTKCDHPSFCKRMLLWNRKNQIVRVDWQELQVRVFDPVFNNCNINFIGFQHAIKICYWLSNNFYAYCIVLRAVFGKSFRNRVTLCRVRHTDGKMIHHVPAILQLLLQQPVQPQHFLGAADHLFPLFGHNQAAASSFKYSDIELLLQRTDVLAHRRQGNGELFCSSAETAALINFHQRI